jgi:GTP cyclohydrolase I
VQDEEPEVDFNDEAIETSQAVSDDSEDENHATVNRVQKMLGSMISGYNGRPSFIYQEVPESAKNSSSFMFHNQGFRNNIKEN